MNTIFIVIEGADNRGKGTIVKELQAHYLTQGKTVVTFISPNRRTISGKKISELLKSKEKPDPVIIQSLIAVNRLEELPDLRRALKHADMVLSDRYYPSGFVYGYLDGLPLAFSELIADPLPEPDHIFVLYGKNHKPDGDGECYDNQGETIEKIYVALASRYKWTLIPNQDSPQAITTRILKILEEAHA